MESEPALLTSNPTGQPNPKKKRKRNGRGRPTRSVIAGRLTWLRCLVRSGALADAAAFHRKHGLHRYGATVPTVPPADTATVDPLAPQAGFASHGGAGGQQRLGRENWDKTTQNGQNLQYGCTTTPPPQNSQCSPLATATAVPLAVEADLTRLAAKADYTPTVTPPTGESEGDSEKVNTIRNEASRLASMWPKVGEGIVGKMCRNKQYNELRVVGEDGREMWTKVGNWLFTSGLIRGERVLVRKIWGSGDDTDAEYEVVRRLDVNEPAEERRTESGSDSGSESVPQIEDAVVAHESAVHEQQTPEASLDAQQTPVAILPQFQREEPDYPRKQESADDYIARIRAEAAMWANGQGR